ncbi:aldo/keto reductase, putative [Talaromyces stipitatus ATCC 10500]|uniref:Aldo/keto reductase, putative n=2 Tax=Talaromyces stipitatus TaxID=28564 RepID=B8MFY2_TALSN|nr:aldo/keto reductase, putative [Talaromyces stipitatus ATCC 10500]AWS21673.1 aldo/keto reductase [Talaromyces stipitatus]AWS21687.1 aldo/keto reductase [Talaromyces stipitatus]EED15849.1 aldo/keto reductase, putative [Talaromyces stipitatus ATCC 10500]
MGDMSDPVLASIAETKAKYVRLGKSGLRVSVPILGAMSLGHKDWQPWVIEEEEALIILKAAYDRGVNTWNTANVYSNGISEEIIGKAIRNFQIPREKLVIMTQCSSWVGDSPKSRAWLYREKCAASKDFVNQGGLSRKALFSAVEASLQRLGVEYIDLLQIHRFDYNTPVEEVMEALHDLIKSGKVRYIGASSMWTYQFAMMQHCAETNGWTKFISMQNHYNLLYREEEREMNKFCNETGVGLVPWAPLCRGYLARPVASPQPSDRAAAEQKMGRILSVGHTETDHAIINRVEEIAQKRGWKMSTVALAWITKRVSSPIIGFSTVERIDEALSAKDKKLTAEEEEYLEELYESRAVQGHF